MGDEIDEATKNRVAMAWNLIRQQYYEKSKTVASEEGPGISIFRFLRETNRDHNCTYFYAAKDEIIWKMIMSQSPDGEVVEKLYDHDKHVLVSVQIPLGIHGDDTIGTMKLYDRHTGEELVLSIQDSEGNHIEKSKEMHLRKVNQT